ncbi:hypothetical protein HMPREF9551_03317 [Escherichia coli MS 196-1]|nr:hypothetical protein HMPREF9551_03317 [Escherichia coli MS 196-1]
MFGHIFRPHVAHERPAVNEFQAGEMGKKMALFHSDLTYDDIIRSLWRDNAAGCNLRQ